MFGRRYLKRSADRAEILLRRGQRLDPPPDHADVEPALDEACFPPRQASVPPLSLSLTGERRKARGKFGIRGSSAQPRIPHEPAFEFTDRR